LCRVARRREGRQQETGCQPRGANNVTRVCIAIEAKNVGQLLDQGGRCACQGDRPFGAPELHHGLGQLGDGVVGDHAGAVRCLAAGCQGRPDERFFTRLNQIRALIAEGDGIPADLADCLGSSLENVGVLGDDVV
jgi:hypothetical protein